MLRINLEAEGVRVTMHPITRTLRVSLIPTVTTRTATVTGRTLMMTLLPRMRMRTLIWVKNMSLQFFITQVDVVVLQYLFHKKKLILWMGSKRSKNESLMSCKTI